MFEDLVDAIANNDFLSSGLKDTLLNFMQTTNDAANQLNSLFGNGLTRLNVKIYSGGIVAGVGMDPGTEGTDFTGVFLLFPAITVSSVSYYFGAMASGVLQFGVTTTGDVYTTSGSTVINNVGITITGILTALIFRGTVGSNTREMTMSLQSNGAGDTPIGMIQYQDPTLATNLLTTNPGFETGDTTSYTLTGGNLTVSTVKAKSGTYSLKASGSGTIETERIAITAGIAYDAGYWETLPGLNVSSTAYLRFYDASSGGNQIGGSIYVPVSGSSSGEFRTHKASSQLAPVGATHAEIYVSATGADSSNPRYFDDFFISASPVSSSLSLEPDFVYRKNGKRREFVYDHSTFTPNILLTGTTANTPITGTVRVLANTMSDGTVLRVIVKGGVLNQTGGNATLTVGGCSLTLATSTVVRGFEYTIDYTPRRGISTGMDFQETLFVESATVGTPQVNTKITTSTTAPGPGADFDISISATLGSALGTMYLLSKQVEIIVFPTTDTTAQTFRWLGTFSDTTYLASVAHTTNFSSATQMNVGESNTAVDVYRTLLRRTTATLPVLPSGAVVTGSKIRLWFRADGSSNARDYKVYRILRDWSIGNATWDDPGAGPNWNSPGCGGSGTDYFATPLATTNVAASNTLDTVCEFALDATETQKILNGTYTNYGFLIKADTESNDAWGFYANGEPTKVSLWPTWEISYTIPPTGNE